MVFGKNLVRIWYGLGTYQLNEKILKLLSF